MKLFVDSANLRDIGDALERGFVAGVTTNPSILSKEERRDYREHIADIIELLTKHSRPLPLSVEVFTTDPDEMIVQAEAFIDHFGDYKPLTIKIPVGWDELRVIATLAERGVAVNATCGMSLNQAMMAVNVARDTSACSGAESATPAMTPGSWSSRPGRSWTAATRKPRSSWDPFATSWT